LLVAKVRDRLSVRKKKKKKKPEETQLKERKNREVFKISNRLGVPTTAEKTTGFEKITENIKLSA